MTSASTAPGSSASPTTRSSGAGRQPVGGEVNARLAQVANSEVAVAQLLAGVLGSGDASPDDLFADLQPAPAIGSRPQAGAGREAGAGDESRGRAVGCGRGAAAERAAAERAERAERERRKEALVTATREHSVAVKARHRADAALEKAEASAERARAALAAAEHEADDRAAPATRPPPPKRPPSPPSTPLAPPRPEPGRLPGVFCPGRRRVHDGHGSTCLEGLDQLRARQRAGEGVHRGP